MSDSNKHSSPVEMKETVEHSRRDAWEYFDAPPTWVLKSNRDFSIELLQRYTHEDRQTEQPEWASAFPNDTTHKDTARVQYRGVPFDQKTVLRLDEFRATVVLPSIDHEADEEDPDRYWTPYEAQLSHIMSGRHLEGYLPGLDVQIKQK